MYFWSVYFYLSYLYLEVFTSCPPTSRLTIIWNKLDLHSPGVVKKIDTWIWCEFDHASSLIRGNERPTRCNRRVFFIAELIVRSTCFGQHYAHHQELKSIIRWLLRLVLGALVYRLSFWCGAVGCESGLRDAAASRIMVPEICWANNKFCNKKPSVASSLPFIST